MVIGWLFVAIGASGLVYGMWNLHPLNDFLWATGSRLVALAGGVLLLRGVPWAKWVLVAWLAFHVVLGAMHSTERFAVHAVLMAVICFFLFRPRATAHTFPP